MGDQLTSSEKEVTDLKTKLNQAEEEKEKKISELNKIRPKIEAIKIHVLELETAKSKIALQLEEKSAALENILSVSKMKDTTVDELRASKTAMEEDNADLKLAIQSLSNQVRESEAKSNENDLKDMELKN